MLSTVILFTKCCVHSGAVYGRLFFNLTEFVYVSNIIGFNIGENIWKFFCDSNVCVVNLTFSDIFLISMTDSSVVSGAVLFLCLNIFFNLFSFVIIPTNIVYIIIIIRKYFIYLYYYIYYLILHTILWNTCCMNIFLKLQ